MKAYFLRRLLLIPLTLLGITALVFSIIRSAPGGPVVNAIASMTGGDGGKRSRAQANVTITAAQVLDIEEKFHRDKSAVRAYCEWLGVLPRDIEKGGMEFPKEALKVDVPVPGTTDAVTVIRNPADNTVQMRPPEGQEDIPAWEKRMEGWEARLRTPEEQAARWQKWVPGVELKELPQYRAVIYRPGFDGLLQGSLGRSIKYQDQVGTMIVERLPVSLYFAAMEMILIYGICIPLGILKAIRHRTFLDNASSFAVFAGYAVPGYALGSLLIVFLGNKLGWFPIRGFTGDDFEALSPIGKAKDLLEHTVMPLACYLIGAFALMTMMVKNNLMDNLAADYVRTATAKGVSYPTAVFRHAFRNSIIPIATTIGTNLALVLGGSILIERVFDINGFGLLQFTAVLDQDEPVIMGVLFFAAALTALGKVISDLCVALVDPRVSYK